MSITNASSIMLLPASLLLGYLLPAALMSLPSPSFVTNSFQQMAIVLWNVFPILVFMVHRVLSELDRLLFPCKAGRGLSPERHLRAARFAYSCAMIVGAVSHLSYMLLGTFTMLFTFMFHLEYARAFSPKKLMVPPFTWDFQSPLLERGYLDSCFGIRFLHTLPCFYWPISNREELV